MGKDVTDMGQTVTDVGCNKKEKRELKKHAATIHCSNTLSLLQRKVANALLYHAYGEMMQKEEHEITVKQLCRLIGYHGNNQAAIKEALKGLISTIIEWNLIDDATGTENWTASTIIASVSLEGPLCYYAYSPRMKQLLHSPSMFGKIDLVIQSNFRSSYGLALYENCIRYRGLPHTKWFDMELFKKLMGVPAGKYDIFRDFKRRVLDKAIEEVNTYSDLVIAAEFVKEGRKVVRLRFKLKDRAKRTRLGTNQIKEPFKQLEHDPIKTKLHTVFGLSEEQIEQVLTSYDAAFVSDKIRIVEESKPFKDGTIQNLAAYLISAIKNNFQAKKTKSVSEKTKSSSEDIEMAEIKRHLEKIRKEYANYREQVITNAVGALTIQEKDKLMQQFSRYAEPVINTILQLQRKKYNRDNIYDSPQVKALLRQFAIRELNTLAIKSMDEFAEELTGVKREAWKKLKGMDPEHPLLKNWD
jgi:hypothetical protein